MLQQLWSLMLSAVMLAATPATSNYKLNSFGFGSGGVGNASTANYGLEGITGEVGGAVSGTATYSLKNGQIQSQQPAVPTATLTNPAQHYNKLKLVIGAQNNPADATFAIAISTDDFTTTSYVQNDNTVGPSLALDDYQTHVSWGGTGGFFITGLQNGTTYKVKVKARHGKFSETGYGPASSAATVEPSISFAVSTDTQTTAPFSLAFGDLLAGNVVNAPDKIWADFATNGESGGLVFIAGQNTGLKSLATSYTITSSTSDLSSASQGFGAQSESVTQTSGGPLAVEAPYNGTLASVGVTSDLLRPIYKSAGPISGGRGALRLKAKASLATPAATDYAEVITLIGSASY